MNDLDATLQQVALPLAIVGYVQNDEETINGIIQTNPNAILIDYIPDNDPGNLFSKLCENQVHVPYVYIGQELDIAQMQKVAELGIENCLTWPVDAQILGEVLTSLYIRASNSTEMVYWTVDKYYRQPISISSLAEENNISINQLIRSFKNKYGITPLQFLISKRMEEARFLLVSTNMPIKMIAHIVGYPNVKYFNHLFAKCYRQTAASYRANYNRTHLS